MEDLYYLVIEAEFLLFDLAVELSLADLLQSVMGIFLVVALHGVLEFDQDVLVTVDFISHLSTGVLDLLELQVEVLGISLDLLDPLDDFLFKDLLAVLHVCYGLLVGGVHPIQLLLQDVLALFSEVVDWHILSRRGWSDKSRGWSVLSELVGVLSEEVA